MTTLQGGGGPLKKTIFSEEEAIEYDYVKNDKTFAFCNEGYTIHRIIKVIYVKVKGFINPIKTFDFKYCTQLCKFNDE